MTIEKSAEKVQGMLGLLNHSLSMFEKDFAQIKDKCAAETALVKATFTTDVDALIEGHKKGWRPSARTIPATGNC